ncbi:hypothetical protein QYE76_068994 [Lolium multiflorum]|uniref:Reverse transcriptase domain-containing protein n=1 Tax=Lolium multiflorum TaxID=4521 RepID=A0AAD8SGD6_LOLMU|nr:hypothetical protein QYE76_068994 [Lolium multiflorum]
MAEEQITYEDLPAEHKKKYDELKAICEAELIGSFAKTRSHGIKVKGGTRSSPGVNMVDLSHSIREPGFSFGVNMAGLVSRHSTDKAESSHSRGKDKEEAVPRDPRDDDRIPNRGRAIDFRNLNSATPKDEYPMPAETLINAAAGHKILSFMDGNAYNQIFMAPEDIHKTAFRVPGSVGLFEYVVMTFGLKNAGATYQRAMNYIFHDLIGKLVEIYIDDVVVKSVATNGHLEDLRQVLDRTRKFGLRMNPKKCAFGVTAGQFLGFLVHERGIEIGLKSQEAVRTMKPPTTKKELQCLIGKINFVRRFISNLSGRIEPFMGLVKYQNNTGRVSLSNNQDLTRIATAMTRCSGGDGGVDGGDDDDDDGDDVPLDDDGDGVDFPLRREFPSSARGALFSGVLRPARRAVTS